MALYNRAANRVVAALNANSFLGESYADIRIAFVSATDILLPLAELYEDRAQPVGLRAALDALGNRLLDVLCGS